MTKKEIAIPIIAGLIAAVLAGSFHRNFITDTDFTVILSNDNVFARGVGLLVAMICVFWLMRNRKNK